MKQMNTHALYIIRKIRNYLSDLETNIKDAKASMPKSQIKVFEEENIHSLSVLKKLMKDLSADLS